MSRSQLTYLVQNLPAAEAQSFAQQLRATTRQREQVLAHLFELVRAGKSDKQEIYQLLYPDRTFSDQQIRNLRSLLLQRLLDFLARVEFDASADRALYLARRLRRLGLLDYYPQMVQKMAAPSNTQLGVEAREFSLRMEREEVEYKQAQGGRRELEADEWIQQTEATAIVRMLYQGLARWENRRLHGKEMEPPPLVLWDEIQSKLEAGQWADDPLVQLYHRLYRVAQEPENETHYSNAKGLLSQWGPRLAPEDAQHLYTLALNRCVRLRNAGWRGLLPEIFHLYREMLALELFGKPQALNPWHYKTLVICGLQLGFFDWVESFMEGHRPQLDELQALGLPEYCEGLLAFYREDWEEAERQMNETLGECKDPFLGLDARTYLLRIYYRRGNVTGMDALINSFRLFLRRHQQLSARRLENYKLFLAFFRKLVTLPALHSKRHEKLREEIAGAEMNAGKEWFLAQLDRARHA